MPQLELATLTQRAVLWRANGSDAYGEPTVDDASVEVAVRWNTKRREITDKQGNTVAYDAVAMVDRKIAVGSVMWLGRLSDLQVGVAGFPTVSPPQDDLYQVASYSEQPDIKGQAVARSVTLMRYKGCLPSIGTPA
jgi:hypothetical protein